MSQSLISAGDYDAILAAVMQTPRGRWFLEEFARRNRHADTAVLLAALERIEASVAGGAALPRIAAPALPPDVDLFAEAEEIGFAEEPAEVEASAADAGAAQAAADAELFDETETEAAWDMAAAQEFASPPELPRVEPPVFAAPEPEPEPEAADAEDAFAAAEAAWDTGATVEPLRQESPRAGPGPSAAEIDAMSFEEKSVYFA